MRRTFLSLVLIAALGAGRSSAQEAPIDWRDAARRDLDAIHRALQADHPAVVVDRDAEHFRAWLEPGYAQALARLPQVVDGPTYTYAIQGYVGGFRDAHVAFFPNVAAAFPHTLRWPGFTTRWNGRSYVVTASTGDGVPADGAVLLDCDGVTPERIARSRLDVYEADLDLAAGRLASAYRLLWDRNNPFVPPPPARCRFQEGAEARDYRLTYREATPEAFRQAANATLTSAKGPPGLRSWHDDRHWWLTLPSSFMQRDGEWDDLFRQVDERLSDLRGARVLVIDARGTGGGSSGYANGLARRLWGTEMVAAYRPVLGDVLWRVSPDNRAFIETVLADLAKDATLGADLSNYRERLRQFDEARETGQTTILEAGDATRPTPPAVNPMIGRVVLLTDGACVSACLDFMDLFTGFPNVVQAGSTTDADTIFMEAARLPLPSGKGLFDVPHKAWVQRPRRSNQPYSPRPDLTYTGDPADDAAERAWLWDVMAAEEQR